MERINFKQMMRDAVIRRAKDLAWDSLYEQNRQDFLKEAQRLEDEYKSNLALKIVEEAEAAMNAPGYLSHIDPSVYRKK